MRLRDNMPELEGAGVWYNSAPIKRASLIGNKPTLFHFWSVSCKLCKVAMPNINKIRDNYKDLLNVIAVHMPRSEKDQDFERIKQVAEQHDMTQPIYVDNAYALTDAFRNNYVPAYYLFDHNGKLRHFQSGGGGMNMLQKRVDRVLNK